MQSRMQFSLSEWRCCRCVCDVISRRRTPTEPIWQPSRSGTYTGVCVTASPMLLCCLPLSSPWATVPRPMGWAYSVSSYSCVNMPSAHWSQNRTGPRNNFTVHVHIKHPVIHFPLAFYYFTIWLFSDSHSNTGQSASLFSSIRDGCFCF